MKAYSKTDIGSKRTMNQDSVYCNENSVGSFQNLFIVADGMGGHKAGDYASRLCVEKIVYAVEQSKSITPVTILEEAVTEANKGVLEEAKANAEYEGMGTTMVAATIFDHHMCVGNVGDSRLYVYHEGQLQQVTQDHSVVGEMVRKGEMPKEQARNHPKRNLITRAVGAEKEIRVDFFDETLADGDLVLMCTDGLTSMVEEEQIEEVLASAVSLQEKTNRLVELANDNGGKDNITVIIIEPFSDEV